MIIELIVARVPVSTPICPKRELILTEVSELVCEVMVETLLPVKELTDAPPACSEREDMLLPTRELTVAWVPVQTPVCDAREDILLPRRELTVIPPTCAERELTLLPVKELV